MGDVLGLFQLSLDEIVLVQLSGGNFSRWELSRGNCLGGNCPTWELSGE